MSPDRPRSRPSGTLLAAGLAILVAAVVAVALLVSSSSSSPGDHPARGPMESIFQDDQLLLYSPQPTVVKTLDTLHGLGVDRVRVTVLWLAVAPAADATTEPSGFKASDPAAYGAAAWAPYDRLTKLAGARGIGVDFNVTAPGPLWAMGRPAPAKYATHYRVNPTDFGQFVTAVGRRYSGTYAPPGSHGKPLPRVNYWSVWNEPNQPGWLAPQWGSVGGQRVMVSPGIYRANLDAAYAALRSTGHTTATDTILIGELAPEGSEATTAESPITPLPFLRTLYCLDGSYQPLRGPAAAGAGCPASGSPSAFVSAHPALFEATGFAHHPYSFFLPPSASMSDQNFAPLSDLPRLERTLDRIFAVYGVHRQLPLYFTEYGYETNPPNPYRGVSLSKQAQYLDEAQYMAWKDPRVRAMAQFLLVDSAPDRSFPKGSIGYWSTFQTGLQFLDGAHKPSFDAYRLPIYVPNPTFHSGGSLFVWAMLRPAPNDTLQHAQIQWSSGDRDYRTIASVSTTDPSGFLTTDVKPPGSGLLRVQWVSSAGTAFDSRSVSVREG
jgi:hypothetical protein